MLRYSKQNSCDGDLPKPTGPWPLPIFHHILPIKQPLATMPSYFAKERAKQSQIFAVCYPLQLKVRVHTWKSFPIHNALCNGCQCRVCMYMATYERLLCMCILCGFFIGLSLLFAFTCKMACENLMLKYICGVPTKIYLHKYLTHQYFYILSFCDLQYTNTNTLIPETKVHNIVYLKYVSIVLLDIT